MNINRLQMLALLAASLLTSVLPASDWPQWRGPARDGHSPETGLLKEWPESGPPVVWTVKHLGESYASLAVVGNRILTTGNIDGEGRVLCLSTEDGSLLWSIHPANETKEYKHQKGNGGRGTPTIDGDYGYVIGGGGDLTCFKIDSGSVVWSRHLKDDFGGSVPGWGYSESPLVDGNRLIVTPGGTQGAVAALNKQTGEVIWRSEGLTDKAHYCSAVVVESQGVRQIIQFTGGIGGKRDAEVKARVVGLDAETGHLLWSYDKSGNQTANVATPIFQKDQVFTSSAYGTGGGLVHLTKSESGFSAEEKYFEKKMANHHGGIVLVDGYMYGFGSGGLICMNFETGEIAWQARSVSKGSLLYADGHLYCYGEGREVALVEANPKEYTEKGRFRVADGEYPCWAHPVIAGSRLYLRDMQTLTSYDIKAK